MTTIKQKGKYKLLYFSQKWNDVLEEVEVVKIGLFGRRKTVTTKKYAETGLVAHTEAFSLRKGDIIVESKYYGGYYNLAVLRKTNEDEEQ